MVFERTAPICPSFWWRPETKVNSLIRWKKKINMTTRVLRHLPIHKYENSRWNHLQRLRCAELAKRKECFWKTAYSSGVLLNYILGTRLHLRTLINRESWTPYFVNKPLERLLIMIKTSDVIHIFFGNRKQPLKTPSAIRMRWIEQKKKERCFVSQRALVTCLKTRY